MIYLKEGVDPNDLLKLHHNLYRLISYAAWYCEDSNLKLVITSLISDRDGVKAKSNTHAEGRAFDIRIRNWPYFQAVNFVNLCNERFKDIAAISSDDLIPRAAKLKSTHIHLQVRP